MSTLSKEDKDLILDFYFRCGDEEAINRGRDLIASNPEAARLYASLEETLTDLDSIKYEPCPDNLAELTVARLMLAASASKAVQTAQPVQTGQERLEQLLRDEERKASLAGGSSRRRWLNFVEAAAVAAVFLVVGAIGLPVFRHVRSESWQSICQSRASAVGSALARYVEDYASLPYVAMAAGSPWWKVGYQGKENQSNTRSYWLLVSGGYADGASFTCPGDSCACPAASGAGNQADQLDFPCRNNVSFSFRLVCDKPETRADGPRTVVMTDRNPIFVRIPVQADALKQDEFGRISLDEQLKRALSPNHRGRGQNVLMSDGSVWFLRERTVGGDDIFTLADVYVYTGREAPRPGDIIVVP